MKEPRSLDVIIPCYNERATVEQVIRSVQTASDSLALEVNILVVDDGSNDGSREFLSEHADELEIQLLIHEENRGKGAAVGTGIKAGASDLVIIQDADLEYDPAQYPVVLAPICEGRADVVYGSRFTGGGAHRVVYFWHMVGNRFLTLVSNMFTNLNLTDMETGYKAFRRSVIADIDLREKRFGFEPEITAKVAREKVRIYEVGITYFGRSYDEGKKIGWKDGVRALYAIFRYNLFR